MMPLIPLDFERLDAIAGTLLEWLLHALVYGTALALVTWTLLRSAMRSLRPAIHTAFWLVVLVKFVLPVGPGWNYSLASLVERVSPTAAAARPAPPTEMQIGFFTFVDSSEANTAALPTVAANAPKVAASVLPHWTTLLVLAYLTGLLIVACARLIAYRRFMRETRRLPLADAAVAGRVFAACRRLGVRAAPCVRISGAVPAPFVINAWKPTLVLSHRQLADRDELDAVILHELAHLRRGDLLVRYVQWLAGTILYFWPVVAWVNRRIDLAREHACDEWALRHGRLSPTQYARCLLKAARPVRSHLVAYAPAAMAANPKHVERRIDMIINNASQPRKNRMLGFLAGAALCGWAGFVLTGATAVVPAAEPGQTVTQAEQPKMMWLALADVQSGDGAEAIEHVINVEGMPAAGAWFGAAPENMQMFVFSDQAPGTEGHKIEVACIAAATNIAGFEKAHPGADADGDGTVSKAEHDAYLIALAMHAPSGVLQRYPQADRNGDGTLDSLEAAWLVVSPPSMPQIALAGHGDGAATVEGLPLIMKMRLNAGGSDTQDVTIAPSAGGQPRQIRMMKKITNENGVITEETQEGDNPPVIRVRKAVEGESAATEPKVETVATRLHRVMLSGECTAAGEGVTIKTAEGDNLMTRFTGAVFNADIAEPPVMWLLQNVSASPSTVEVARFVPVAESAPLSLFLQQNPKADRNKDGTLTVEERDEYVEKHQTAARTRILEQHPEADANSDGILSNDEMKSFFRTRAAGGAVSGRWVGADGSETPVGAARRVVVRRAADGSAPESIEVEVIADESQPK